MGCAEGRGVSVFLTTVAALVCFMLALLGLRQWFAREHRIARGDED